LRRRQIKLHYFVSSARPGVCDIGFHGEIVSSFQRLGGKLQVAEGERRVAQAISEGIEGVSVEVAVGAALHGVVLKRRDLIDTLIESQRQASPRVIFAVEGLGNRLPA